VALYRCEGVVLRTRDLAEADRLVIMYTPDRGKHQTIAQNARRPRSRLAAGIQPFTRALYLCWRGRSLDGISQVEVIEGFPPLRTNLERLAAATYACELIDVVTQENDPQPRLFALLVFTLRALAEVDPEPPGLERLLLSYQWKLLALAGFRPAFDRCTLCGEPVAEHADEVVVSLAEGGVVCDRHAGGAEATRVLPAAVTGAVLGMLRSPLRSAVGLQLSPGAAAALAALSRDYLAYHLERYPQSRVFLEELRQQAHGGAASARRRRVP